MAKRLQLRDFNNLLVGVLLAVSFAVIAVTGLLTLQHMEVFREKYSLKMVLKQNIGINIGTKVKVNGVEVGKISELELMEDGQVRLTLQIAKQYENHITTTSIAYPTRDQNIISDRIIMVTHGAGGEPLLEGMQIAAGQAQDLETLVLSATALMGRLDGMMDKVDTILNLVVDTNRTLGAMLSKRDLYDKVDRLVDVVDRAGASALHLMDTLDGAISPLMVVVDTLMADVSTIARRGVGTMEKVDGLLGSVDGMVDRLDLMLGAADGLLVSGEEKLERADDLLKSISDMWFIRSGLPDRSKSGMIAEELW